MNKMTEIAINRICEKTTIDRSWLMQNSSVINTENVVGMQLYDSIQSSKSRKVYEMTYDKDRPDYEPVRLFKVIVLEYTDPDGYDAISLDHVVFASTASIDETVRQFIEFYKKCVKLEWQDTRRHQEYWSGYYNSFC